MEYLEVTKKYNDVEKQQHQYKYSLEVYTGNTLIYTFLFFFF